MDLLCNKPKSADLLSCIPIAMKYFIRNLNPFRRKDTLKTFEKNFEHNFWAYSCNFTRFQIAFFHKKIRNYKKRFGQKAGKNLRNLSKIPYSL